MRLERQATALCALVTALGLAHAAQAEIVAQYRDWQLVRMPEACRLVSALVSPASGALLLEAIVMPADAPGALLFALRVPVGAHLPSGISYRHVEEGRQAIGLDWLSCDAQMCTAAGQLSGQAVARLKRDRSVFVGFRPMQAARPINLELSLMGFTAGHDALGRCVPG